MARQGDPIPLLTAGEDVRSGEWHRAIKNTGRWALILAIVCGVATGGFFLILNPQYENPRNPFHAGPVLLITAAFALVLPAAVSMLDLVAVKFSPSELALRLRSGRVLKVPWRSVGDCRYFPDDKTLSLTIVGRAFGWRTRFEKFVGNDLIRQFKKSRNTK